MGEVIGLADARDGAMSNLQAERVVLASMLRGELEWRDCLIEPSDFSTHEHQRLYRALVDIDADGNALSVGALLDAGLDLAEVGGAGYVFGLPAGHRGGVANHARMMRAARDRRRLAMLGARMQEHAQQGKDPSTIISDLQTEFASGVSGGIRTVWDWLSQWDNSAKASVHIPAMYGDITGPLEGGWFIVLGARPAVGKTTMAALIAAHCARLGKRSLFLSLEMTGAQIARKTLAAEVGRQAPDENVRFLVASRKYLANVLVDDAGAQSVARIASLIQRERPALVIVDYLQLMDGPGDTREQQIARISRGLKRCAVRYDVPIIALAQLNRRVEDRNGGPILSDLRESGSLEQDADQVWFLHRAADVVGANAQLEFIVAKNRHGATGKRTLMFDGSTHSFAEIL